MRAMLGSPEGDLAGVGSREGCLERGRHALRDAERVFRHLMWVVALISAALGSLSLAVDPRPNALTDPLVAA